MKRVALSVVVAWSLACAGFSETECCSVEDIISMQREGVSKTVMIDAIRTSGRDLALSANDLTDLDAAGVDSEVIDVLNGGPCVCQEQGSSTVKSSTPKKAGGLRLRVVYKGGKSFEVVNLSSVTYTGVSVVVNGEYQYRLKRLPAGKTDVMRYGNFRSTKTGEELRKGKLRSITIRAKQGSYSQSF